MIKIFPTMSILSRSHRKIFYKKDSLHQSARCDSAESFHLGVTTPLEAIKYRISNIINTPNLLSL